MDNPLLGSSFKPSKDKYDNDYVFWFGVASLLGACGFMAKNPDYFSLGAFVPCAVTAVGSTGWWIWHMTHRSKLDYFFKAANLQCEDKYPRVLKKKKLPDGEEYKILMPVGMDVKDFENKKAAMEKYLKGRAEIWWDNNLYISINRKKLKEEYPFELERCPELLKVLVGHGVNGEKVYLDIEDAPHVLIAGTTGGGKSVLLRSIIASLVLAKDPAALHLNLVDFQRVELGIFRKCRMVRDFIYTPHDFEKLLDRLETESNRRLDLFEAADAVNIRSYNRRHERLPYILTIVDEFGALAGENKDLFTKLQRRVSQDRKCGLHYILCTQRPSTDVIKGTIKASVPVRIALQTATEVDSRVILDEGGAEKLRGKGHGIIKAAGKTEAQFMFLDEMQAYKMVKPTFIDKPKKKIEQPGVIEDADREGQEDYQIY